MNDNWKGRAPGSHCIGVLRITRVNGPVGVALLLAGAVVMGGVESKTTPTVDLSVGGSANVLLVSLCSVRVDHMSCYGYPRRTTPHLDEFAERAIVFEHAVTQWPKTAPAFASIMTGKYGHSTGVMRITPDQRLGAEHITLAEVLRGRGYDTGAFLSTAALNTATNITQGFGFVPPIWSAKDRFLRATEATEAWLRARQGRQFFAWVHYNNAHWPYAAAPVNCEMFVDDEHYDPTRRVTVTNPTDAPVHVPDHPYRMQIERPDIGGTRSVLSSDRDRWHQLDYYIARYDAGVFASDLMIGDLLDRLNELGLLENTIVAVVGDHGEALGDHNYYFEHGRLPYDACARVPLMIRLPGLDRSMRVATPVAASGLAATLLELVGAPIPTAMELPSLLPAIRGEVEDPLVFTESGYQLDYTLSVRDEKWKLIHVPNPEDRSLMQGSEFELYDLEVDPLELDNVVGDNPEIATRLRRVLHDWARPWVDEAYQRLGDSGPVIDAATEECLRELGYVE